MALVLLSATSAMLTYPQGGVPPLTAPRLPAAAPLRAAPTLTASPLHDKAQKLEKAVGSLAAHHNSLRRAAPAEAVGTSKTLLAASAALTGWALATSAPPRALAVGFCTASLSAASLGFLSLHAAVTYGYGLALVGHAAAMCRHAAAGRAPTLLLATVLLYGVKVCVLQLARDLRPAYARRVLPSFAGLVPATKCPFTKSVAKLPIILSVAVLLAAYAMPLWVVCHASAGTSGVRAAVSLAGCALALTGLAVQTVADVQKFAAKDRLGADAPILGTGLWAYSRHPNYAADIVFHLGTAATAVACSGNLGAAWISMLGPAGLIAVILVSTKSLERRQLMQYKSNPDFVEYHSRTPRLFPGAPSPSDAAA
ncbi:hypothetical protein AB1Y20_011079 [Prymnesium parvum]|uniref:Steroid 5-alpha reductase C-terminal domain-containing protein n=1 Tax=Prymnesium parvum TaxID=97485 RepID=A0AB34ILL6_PRYPA